MFNFMKMKMTTGRNDPDVGLGQMTFSVYPSHPWKPQCTHKETSADWGFPIGEEDKVNITKSICAFFWGLNYFSFDR